LYRRRGLRGAPLIEASNSHRIGGVVGNGNARQLFAVLRLRFRSGRFSRPEEIVRLFIIALVGLGLNTAVVWLLARILRLDPTLTKILAVFPVFAWNYLGRRSMVFDGGPPVAIALLAERVRGKRRSKVIDAGSSAPLT
jgi:hypothetical protein